MPPTVTSPPTPPQGLALRVAIFAAAVGTLSPACHRASVPPAPPDGETGSLEDTGGGVETIPSARSPWLRQEIEAPGSIGFSEILYHPVDDEDLEWLELHNPMVLDMDLSGWALGGGLSYGFPDGSILPAGGYLVVAADPAWLASQTGFADALGPYQGKLSDGGERIELRNNSGRLIDTVEYGQDEPWPVRADGSGLSLAKMDPDATSDHAENWTVSAEVGGTPGASNLLDPLLPPTTVELVSDEASWRYDVSGDYPAEDWAEPAYDDSWWDSGPAVFYAGGLSGEVEATAWVTADNYYALYLGEADGSALRLVGQDADGSWTTVEDFALEPSPSDHLYLAAWELTGDSTSPQMAIGEVELPEEQVGTSAETFEWVLGPTDACPGSLPANPAPSEEDLAALIEQANADGAWAPPGVERDRGASPWGGAVSAWFTDTASFIWGDTFDTDSVTNIENSYALFRSIRPLVSPPGSMELTEIPTTITFRTDFSFHGDPSTTELLLHCTLDDGAVIHLNGVEVLRENMPTGPVDAATLASTPVAEALEASAELSPTALVQGRNVLAVELHQAERHDADMRFGCALTARTWRETAAPPLLLNEVAPADTSPLWVELISQSDASQDTGGLVLVSSAGDEVVLPAETLGPGELLLLDDLGFTLEAGELLHLYAADGSSPLDSVRLQEQLRGRDDGGPWRVPAEATPGEPNIIVTTQEVVIHELQYHRAPSSEQGEPVTARSEEWIELYNRGTGAIDLGGWQLVDAVSFAFPSGTSLGPGAYLVISNDADSLRAEHPDIEVLGDFVGRLGNGGDRVLLLDARGNPADELRYFDGGRWPTAADGGGASLELRDPWSDNAAAEAWAASDESRRTSWEWFSYRGAAEASAVGPDGVWEELVLGLLDSGELLIDDISVVKNPEADPVELLYNGDFDDGSEGWRLLGNHRHSAVVPDPDDPSDPVLRLVATGPTGHMHNHLETTLEEPIGTGEYEISFRARWVSGSNQLHSRLYFNRLPRTTLLPQPALSGTPGAANSTAVDNLGPTFSQLQQDPALPEPYEPVWISVVVDDPDGVAGVSLWSSVDGAAARDQPMVQGEAGRWQAELDGQAAGSVVQIWVEAEDGLGASATSPAAGPDSRALLTFDEGLATDGGLHSFRILMTQADADWLHDDVNLMSDDLVGATVVYQEAEVFYDVGVRAKGSERGRPTALRLGYGVGFHDEQPFRGSHSSVLVDRSEGVGFGQRELLLNLVMTHAGSVSGEYNDLIHLVAPRAVYTGSAELQLDRFSDLVLASQFADGDSGTRFEYELIYYPTTTDDGTAEGNKLPQPDSVVGTALTDLGPDKEAYRWSFLIKNNEREDNYDAIITLCQAMGLSGSAFLEAAGDVIDVEQWLRAFAFATLSGATDQYGGAGSQHNAQFYQRPDDGRMLFFPHDLDFFGSSSMAVVGNGDLAQLLEDPLHARSYYGHLQDIIQRAYNAEYLAPWCEQLGELLPEQDFASHCGFIDDRVDWVMYGSSEAVMTRYPSTSFRITTGGGEDFTVSSAEVSLEGEAWIDVRDISLEGEAGPLPLTWLDDQRWMTTVPLSQGPNELTLVATDLHGALVGTDSITVSSSAQPTAR
jgi:hypothetical protein